MSLSPFDSFQSRLDLLVEFPSYNSASFIQKLNLFSPHRETCEITFFNDKLVAAVGFVSDREILESVPNHSPQSNAEV